MEPSEWLCSNDAHTRHDHSVKTKVKLDYVFITHYNKHCIHKTQFWDLEKQKETPGFRQSDGYK